MKTDFATRLCQEILGEPLVEAPYKSGVVTIPILYAELEPAVLELAGESVTYLGPEHYRLLLPLVLHSITEGREDLAGTGYFAKFFLSICSEFSLDLGEIPIPSIDRPWPLRYSNEYKKGRIVKNLTAFDRFELQWALEWVMSLLDRPENDLTEMASQDLKIFGRVLAMALDVPESDAPALS